jgi:hypothetical protein
MKTVSSNILIQSSPEKVFATIDDLGVTGMHMTKSSAMMMGSKLELKYLTDKHTGPGSKYRWTGTMMGMKMDFTVEVTKWINGIEKTWETIGETKMIIYSWYRMHLLVKPKSEGSEVALSITYEKPKAWFAKIISFLVAGWYCKWCLKNMLNDSKRTLEFSNIKTFFMKLNASKFCIALGLAFAIGFLLCNLIFFLAGDNFSLTIMNSIFHKTDLRSVMTEEGLNFGKLLIGMVSLFIVGAFVGYVTVFMYNTITPENKTRIND